MSDLEIDPDNLEQEILKQPRLLHEAAVAVADARNVHERRKRRRDLAVAECDREARKNPAAFGLDKVTEGSISTVVMLDARVRLMEEKTLTAKHKLDLLQATLMALEDKRRMLEAELSLQLRIHGAEIRGPLGAREQVEHLQKQEVRRQGQVKS